jgi:hypothetical protein
VGVPLTATKGAWSPRATLSYQWVVDGELVPGATEHSFTPRPQDVGKRVTVVVTATRLGYLAASVPSDESAATLPGVIHNHHAPLVSGRAVVGHTLSTTDGTWSITPDEFGYQWYAGHHAIAGATGSTHVVSPAEAGHHIHVVVTAQHAGYTSQPATSDVTDLVVFGRIAFDKPTIGGHAVVGRTLTARLASVEPTTATPHFRWYRDGEPIHGARSAAYVVQEADLGHRLRVVVTMRAENWVSRTKHSDSVTDIKTTPRLHVRTSMKSGRVLLRLTVSSPGLVAPDGFARVWRGGTVVGRFPVVDGHGSRLLARMRHGTHQLKVVYHGGPQETVGRKTVTVTVP